MTDVRIFITAMGAVTPAGCGLSAIRRAMTAGNAHIGPLTLFEAAHSGPLPVGQVTCPTGGGVPPRTHRLALLAAREAMAGADAPPGAIVLGGTTGGMLRTENHLRADSSNPPDYRCHATGSVAACLARETGCTGPVLTISTACSSATAALWAALNLLRDGKVKTVLAGGADSLCRLTFHGFNSLQLIDPLGARPLDRDRAGMTVGEGAAMLLLAAAPSPPPGAICELRGAGLSCDAYHPTTPHPEGRGAVQAMAAALADAGLTPGDIDYVNLHGTGTPDNDRSEAVALANLFPAGPPAHSSIKGALGHSLGAAGAVEAVVAALSVSEGVIPANTGCRTPDPELGLQPACNPLTARVRAVLSNSFGFGGNNASVVIGATDLKAPSGAPRPVRGLAVLGAACLSGAGLTAATLAALENGLPVHGVLPLAELSRDLPAKAVRRLKRLPRIALALAVAATRNAAAEQTPDAVFFGTGWGPLSETEAFLSKLFASDEQFTSPIDFIGSVHNAPAGQVALHFQATGPNITATGGDDSFEQALLAASLLPEESPPLLLIGADEHHERLSPLFDPSVRAAGHPSDGGGGLFLSCAPVPGAPRIAPEFSASGENDADGIPRLAQLLSSAGGSNRSCSALWVGIPAARRDRGERQLQDLLRFSRFTGPVIDYRRHIGEHASASAVAAVLAVRCAMKGLLPPALAGGRAVRLGQGDALVVGLGDRLTAVRVTAGKKE